MAIKQYPYRLEVLSIIENGQDLDGNNLPPSEDWMVLCNCRDEAGNGKQIATVDGTMISYSFLIQMPKGTQAIPAETKVRVMDGMTERCIGKVLYSRKDQLHSRSWV